MIESIKLKLKKSVKTDRPNSCLTQIRTNSRLSTAKADYKLACLNASKSIEIFDWNLAKICDIKPETATTIEINEINFFRQNANIVFDCTSEPAINCWDLRNPRKEIIRIDCDKEKLGFLSTSINCADELISAGTVYDNDTSEAFVFIFDIRKPNSVLKKYTDAHSDDITQIRFHDANSKVFSSASLDGLVCVFDLANMKPNADEKTSKRPEQAANDSDSSADDSDSDDDMITQVYNTNSSVQNIGFLNNDAIYAITCTNDLLIWDMQTQDQMHAIKNLNSKNKTLKFDYFLGCVCLNDTILACLGTNEGSMTFYDIKNNVLLGDITRSSNDYMHADVLRDICIVPGAGDIFTCDDAGRLCKWQFDVINHVNKKRPLIEFEEAVDGDYKCDSNWDIFMKNKNKNSKKK